MYIGDVPVCEQTKKEIGTNIVNIIRNCWNCSFSFQLPLFLEWTVGYGGWHGIYPHPIAEAVVSKNRFQSAQNSPELPFKVCPWIIEVIRIAQVRLFMFEIFSVAIDNTTHLFDASIPC